MRRLAPLLVAVLPGAALADLPPAGCYARDYGADHLAQHPGQGVAGLRLWFFAEEEGGEVPAVLVEAHMADQGQAVRDGVAGQVLTQYAICDPQGSCYVECDGGVFTTQTLDDGGLRISTQYFRVGESDSCGGTSDLAEGEGAATGYRLAAAPAGDCESLWHLEPLPGPGCYGVDYADEAQGQGLRGMRLLLRSPDQGYAFPQAEGTLRVTLPDAGRAREAGMGGARVAVPVWCSARDGLCRSGIDEGAIRAVPLGEDAVSMVTGRFLVYGAEASNLDIAMPGQDETRHLLHRMPDDACRGME
ncbi:MAG: hypothetical protein KDK12_17335 [Rhodobacteraceae bacterium]|nr:hypothetical protein [Paracoccaceae bacterium]